MTFFSSHINLGVDKYCILGNKMWESLKDALKRGHFGYPIVILPIYFYRMCILYCRCYYFFIKSVKFKKNWLVQIIGIDSFTDDRVYNNFSCQSYDILSPHGGKAKVSHALPYPTNSELDK